MLAVMKPQSFQRSKSHMWLGYYQVQDILVRGM
jgi:hypothetical protein